jgi:predicted nuclease of predicted toxin-antitoxin system
MRLLLDANLSPRLVGLLSATGHEVAHVVEFGLITASDRTILDRALSTEGR